MKQGYNSVNIAGNLKLHSISIVCLKLERNMYSIIGDMVETRYGQRVRQANIPIHTPQTNLVTGGIKI